VSALGEAIAENEAAEAPFDLEAVFCAEYARIARIIARVVRDRARAEELAVEVFLKLSRNQQAQGENTGGWLHRVAVRVALDELRRQERRSRYERLAGWFSHKNPTPEDIRAAVEERDRVRNVLSRISRRHAELLVLRGQELTYSEIASALGLNPASIGTLLSRAQQAFRKEYVERYGEH
jgi:RNA polymerase sigma-70 factor, ECF subfamily